MLKCEEMKFIRNCMKYILGQYTGTTGGHHHGHEIYDMKAVTDYNGENIVVAFLMKSENKLITY